RRLSRHRRRHGLRGWSDLNIPDAARPPGATSAPARRTRTTGAELELLEVRIGMEGRIGDQEEQDQQMGDERNDGPGPLAFTLLRDRRRGHPARAVPPLTLGGFPPRRGRLGEREVCEGHPINLTESTSEMIRRTEPGRFRPP